jgi:hypothetical protein
MIQKKSYPQTIPNIWKFLANEFKKPGKFCSKTHYLKKKNKKKKKKRKRRHFAQFLAVQSKPKNRTLDAKINYFMQMIIKE